MRPPRFSVRSLMIAVVLMFYEVLVTFPIVHACLTDEPLGQEAFVGIVAAVYPPLCLAIWFALRAWFRAR